MRFIYVPIPQVQCTPFHCCKMFLSNKHIFDRPLGQVSVPMVLCGGAGCLAHTKGCHRSSHSFVLKIFKTAEQLKGHIKMHCFSFTWVFQLLTFTIFSFPPPSLPLFSLSLPLSSLSPSFSLSFSLSLSLSVQTAISEYHRIGGL